MNALCNCSHEHFVGDSPFNYFFICLQLDVIEELGRVALWVIWMHFRITNV